MVEKEWEYNGIGCQLFINLERAYNSIGRDVLYNILSEFGTHMRVYPKVSGLAA
jgi:hypothetical protein